MISYTYEDVIPNVEAMYDCFYEKEKNEFMLIAALSFAAEINTHLGLNLKTINSLFRKCEKEFVKNMFEEVEGK
ncbi:hypothetical protein UFOVP205_27 [uncultured Caudovirales phage]|uniref:Uncharacterized protein n=1 Tax=uncultured Caudovirales phage TaxID=2100421 RepID=A0A6J7WII7_9CAUD|nr:hypothetical protein UFOVP205_27 [uncultured Caudovirales phage]